MITAVVFDLDDTLYDEIDYCRSGFTVAAEYLAQKLTSADAVRIFDALWNQFAAGNRTRTFNGALEQLQIDYDDNLIEKLIQLYRSHEPDITLPEDSRDVLEQLTGKYTLGLLTDGFLPAQKLKVHALGVEKYFKSIIYTEQLGRQFWKPAPEGFLKLLEELNEKPQNTAYVADNPKKDFIAPNKLGSATIQLTRPARIHTGTPDQSYAAPKHIIGKINELPALLASL